jgi:hypothetical protein
MESGSAFMIVLDGEDGYVRLIHSEHERRRTGKPKRPRLLPPDRPKLTRPSFIQRALDHESSNGHPHSHPPVCTENLDSDTAVMETA